MSRIRNIKPSFFTDEEITELDRTCRLFFIGLWTECDKNGVFAWKPRQLKIKIFSCDLDILSENIESFLDTLLAIDFVRKFDHRGDPFGWVTHFQEHQAISKSERDKGATLAPVPRRWPGTIPERLTVGSGTPDLGHLTKDIGRRTEDVPPAGAVVNPPPAISKSGKAGQPAWMPQVREILADGGMSNNTLDCKEWKAALKERAKVETYAEARAFFTWAKPFMRKAIPEGPLHLRHSGSLTDEWPNKRKKIMERIAI